MNNQIVSYYSYVLIFSSILIIIGLVLGGFTPINEQVATPSYDLALPVSLSFSAFILLIIFIFSSIILWGSKSLTSNLIIDSSALSFSILNYVNFYVIYEIWRPEIIPLPLFFYIHYSNINELTVDFGQIALIIFFYRLYKRNKSV
ncbi:hypothetical protein SUSAZ_01440 [Sulfolobus acidocaldarius SUSAZ]|nr:hypothetical protein SUSAZ_01440 [Sulfolobus acidocaldarius SUSAZ]